MDNGEGSTSSNAVTSSSRPDFSFDLATAYIDQALSPFTNEGSPTQIRTKLRDIMAPVASDFSQICDGILHGATMFSSEESSRFRPGQVHRVALELLNGLGNTHWTAVALLAIAKVLERLDKMSTNKRDCIDLLKSLLDLTKFIKMVKDIKTDFAGDILVKMKEALHLILTGSILCHSFITTSKWSRFVLTKSIGDELVYLRGKVESMKMDILLRMNFILMRSLVSQSSNQHNLTAQPQDRNDSGEMTDVITSTFHTRASDPILPGFGQCRNFTCEKRRQERRRRVRMFATLTRFLKSGAEGLVKLLACVSNLCRTSVHKHSFREDVIPLSRPWMALEDNNYLRFKDGNKRNWCTFK